MQTAAATINSPHGLAPATEHLLCLIGHEVEIANANNCRLRSWVVVSLADRYLASEADDVSDKARFCQTLKKLAWRLDLLAFVTTKAFEASIKRQCLQYLEDLRRQEADRPLPRQGLDPVETPLPPTGHAAQAVPYLLDQAHSLQENDEHALRKAWIALSNLPSGQV